MKLDNTNRLMIESVKVELKANSSDIIVLKGADLDLLNALPQDWFLLDRAKIMSNECILISNICSLSGKMEVLNSLVLNPIESNKRVLLYEQFLALHDNEMLSEKDLKFRILDFSVSQWVKYIGDTDIATLGSKLENETVNDSSGFLDSLYAEYRFILDKKQAFVIHQLPNQDLDVTETYWALNIETKDILSQSNSNGILQLSNPLSDKTLLDLSNPLGLEGIARVEIDSLFSQNPEQRSILSKLSALSSAGLGSWQIEDSPYQPNLPGNHGDPDLDVFLQKYWGENAKYRPVSLYKNPSVSTERYDVSQKAIIQKIVDQYKLYQNPSEKEVLDVRGRDVFITAPTGSGKSLLFQIAAMKLAQDYGALTIVVSPLVALMQDQLENLEKRGFRRAAMLNSQVSLHDRDRVIEDIQNGEIDILYLAPELLLSYNINHFIGEGDNKRQLGLMVIDEAHLVTTWGQNFRVDYWHLGLHIEKIRRHVVDGNNKPMHFPIVALTATAPFGGSNDNVFRTIASLRMSNPIKFIGYVRRNDIQFDIQNVNIDTDYRKQRLEISANRIVDLVTSGTRAIVYCPYRRQVDNLHTLVRGMINDHSLRDRVTIYHGSLEKERRNLSYQDMKNGDSDVMIATKAFGMGVDISDIEVVYHLAPSGDLSDYIQEVGRAARKDDLEGRAIIDYSIQDLGFSNTLFGLSAIKPWQVKAVLSKICQLYGMKKQRNMLLSADQFYYIFRTSESDNENTLENKVKSSMMLLEKDLEQRFLGVKALIARPKNIFTRIYIQVPFVQRHRLTQVIGAEAVTEIGSNAEFAQFDIDLETIWKQKSNGTESFPSFKYKFYNGDLDFLPSDLNYEPVVQFSVDLSRQYSEVFERLEKVIDDAENLLQYMSTTGKYLSQEYIEDTLSKMLKSRTNASAITSYLLSLFSTNPMKTSRKLTRRDMRTKNISSHVFLQKRLDPNGNITYCVFNNGYQQVGVRLKGALARMEFEARNSLHFIKYFGLNSVEFKRGVQLAQLLEGLSLATFETKGGHSPMLFVRLNDPKRLQRLSEDEFYSNQILNDIYTRQEVNKDILTTFFTSDTSNEKRWDFVEQYFLGSDFDDLRKIL